MKRLVKKGLLTAAFTAVAGSGWVGMTVTAGSLVASAFALCAVAGTLPLALGAATIGLKRIQRAWLERKFPVSPASSLTTGETALLESIFGKSIDTARVKKRFSPDMNGNAIGFTAGVTYDAVNVQIFGKQFIEADYSTSRNAMNYGIFVHEMTHIWQNQSLTRSTLSNLLHPVDENDPYIYDLEKKRRFSSFNSEQQGALVQDYALNFLYTGDDKPVMENGTFRPLLDKGRPQNADLLKKLVEDQFPAARQTRLALEGKQAARRPAAAPAL